MSQDAEVVLTEFEPGTRIGSWCVLSSIGRGGMSEVFAVAHERTNKHAALKVLHAEAMTRPRAAERFALEAHVLYQLRHPGVPEIFEIGHCADDRPYLVMELLHGVTLAEATGTRSPPRQVAFQILEQLCNVLAAAHQRGVVHRDLKPENIILLDGDVPIVKLLDWGIAKRVDDASAHLHLTSTGAIVGTPRYLSPEQARSEPVDARTDVYALGLLAYELLLGAFPFEAPSLGETLIMQMVKPPPSPRRYWPDIPASLERTLVGMLAKDPARRPALAAVLETVRDAQRADHGPSTADRMRAGELDRNDTIVDDPPGERTTSRWRPLRR